MGAETQRAGREGQDGQGGTQEWLDQLEQRASRRRPGVRAPDQLEQRPLTVAHTDRAPRDQFARPIQQQLPPVPCFLRPNGVAPAQRQLPVAVQTHAAPELPILCGPQNTRQLLPSKTKLPTADAATWHRAGPPVHARRRYEYNTVRTTCIAVQPAFATHDA